MLVTITTKEYKVNEQGNAYDIKEWNTVKNSHTTFDTVEIREAINTVKFYAKRHNGTYKVFTNGASMTYVNNQGERVVYQRTVK